MDIPSTEGEARRSYNDAHHLETELKDDLTGKLTLSHTAIFFTLSS